MNEWITYMTEHLPSMMDILWAMYIHDGVIKWKHFPQYWLLVRGIHRWPVNSPHKCQWRGALIFSLIWAWINGWVNNRKAGCLRRHRAHYAVTVMNKSYHIHTVLSCFVLLCHCVLLGRFVECNIFTQNVQDFFTGTEEMSTHVAGIFPVCSTVVHQVDITENTTASHKQRVLMHGHQGWNVRHGLCHIYMIYVYIWVVYSFCLFCCLFIIVTTQFVAL